MLLDAWRNFYGQARIARRRVRHRQDVNLCSARHGRRGDDHRARPVLPALILAGVKLPAPQEGVSKDKARHGPREAHLIVEKGVQVIVLR
jgi:hypothetical protein